MNVSANCFDDSELKTFIDSNGEDGVCDVLNVSAKVVNIDEILPFLKSYFDIFEKDIAKGRKISEITSSGEYKIFSNDDSAKCVIAFLHNSDVIDFEDSCIVSIKKDLFEYVEEWKKLKTEITENTRFLYNFDEESYMLSLKNSARELNEGEEFYRGRIENEGRSFDKSQMGAPPKDLASAGRANPEGISFLYLCDNDKTPIYEIRALHLDKVSIGKFILNESIKVVKFDSSLQSIYHVYDENEEDDFLDAIKRYLVHSSIRNDLSKPKRRFDSNLEYIPTQFLCEYFKINGIDGVMFKSSLHDDGNNLVLFDEKKAQCVDVKSVEVYNSIIQVSQVNLGGT